MSVRIGFVGVGGIAKSHLARLSGMEDVELVAFCDIDEERAKWAVSQYGGRAYTDHRRMYDEEEIDAVFICLPPFAHTDQELLAAERGTAIFVEKPIGLSLERAREVASAIKEKGVISSVGYHWRYMGATEGAKEFLKGKDVGFALGYWIGGMPGVWWWRRKEKSGGQVVEQTTHIFDLARYLLGEVAEVRAIARTGLMRDVPDYDVYDVTLVQLAFQSGAVAEIASACITRAGGRVGLEVYGRDWAVKISPDRLEICEPGRTEIREGGGLDEDRVFVQAVSSGDPSGIRSSYEDALRTLELTLAAERSAAEGKPVKLKEG